MPWNMVSGKPSNQSARQLDIPPTTRILVLLVTWFDVWEYVLQGQPGLRTCSRATGVRPAHIECAYGPAVACGGPDPWPGMRGKRLLRDDLWMFQACVLGLPCKVEFDSESSASHEDWDCLSLLPHGVTRAIIWLSKMMFDQRFYHAWIAVGAHLDWIIT
jgi:hypothetical protein